MKTRILKKINDRVRIVENATGGYDVEVRDPSDKKNKQWHIVNNFSQHKKAVEKKNNYIVMVVMRDIGYRNVFVKKRIKIKKIRDKRKRSVGRLQEGKEITNTKNVTSPKPKIKPAPQK